MPGYRLNYDFGNFNHIVASYMDLLADNSIEYFKNQASSRLIDGTSVNLGEYLSYLEEYLHHNYQKFPNNFRETLHSIITNVHTIAVLPNNERGIFGRTDFEDKIIFIHPKLDDGQRLTGKERTRLYMAHELGHVVNNSWMNKVSNYVNTRLRNGTLSRLQANLIYDGFSMLDEAITQNRAENFAYEFARKNRPNLLYWRNPRLFNSRPYRANFDYYGELQEPATMFARTLRGIGSIDNDSRALDMLSNRAISSDFFDKILDEYQKDGQMQSFILELQYMGYLKRASYANFGYGSNLYLLNSASYLENFKNIASNMRDYRPPRNTGVDR